VTYVTGGLSPGWLDALQSMVDAGADLVEVGIPFSDPVMDGPTIQEASVRALAAGASPATILDTLRSVEVPVPLVAMTYYNLVFRGGHARFARLLADSGVRGAIVPDLPLDESGGWEEDAAVAGVETVLLAAPVTPDDRLEELCRRSRGFVYGVNVMGVTGERGSLNRSAAGLAQRLKAGTDKPGGRGFGNSTPDPARGGGCRRRGGRRGGGMGLEGAAARGAGAGRRGGRGGAVAGGARPGVRRRRVTGWPPDARRPIRPLPETASRRPAASPCPKAT